MEEELLRKELNELISRHKAVHVPQFEQPEDHIVMMFESTRKIRWFHEISGATEEKWLKSEIAKYKGYLSFYDKLE
jgi:hypothetical protein